MWPVFVVLRTDSFSLVFYDYNSAVRVLIHKARTKTFRNSDRRCMLTGVLAVRSPTILWCL